MSCIIDEKKKKENDMNLNMHVDIKVLDKEWSGETRDVLKINEQRLTHEFIEHPSTYAWFAALLAYATAETESMKLSHEVLQANLYAEKRLEMAKGSGKVTEDKIKNAVVEDDRYAASQEQLTETKRQHGIVRAIVTALEHRKDMLIQLGATRRQEMFSDGISIAK